MNPFESVFLNIVSHPKYARGITYGKPRRGHAEGTVANHLKDLDANLDRIRGTIDDNWFWKLKILIHVHDTFKKWATHDCPIDDHNSHASLARDFLSKFIEDDDLLKMVQWHDENYALWKQMKKTGHYNEARLKSRVLSIVELELFLTFTVIDGYTPSKMALGTEETPEKLRWFIEEVSKHRKVPYAHMVLELFGL